MVQKVGNELKLVIFEVGKSIVKQPQNKQQ